MSHVTAPDDEPQHDVDAEMKVLGSMLLSGDVVADVTARIGKDSYHRPAHGVIHDVITRLAARGDPHDPVAVANELERLGELRILGGKGKLYLAELIESVAVPAQAGYFAGIVARQADLRKLLEAFKTGIDAVTAPGADPADVEALIRSRLPGAVPAAAGPALQFTPIAELCARVDAAGPRRWLVRGIWPAATYGVHAAEMKAQKTWNDMDLAISAASGTPWLGTFPVDTTGPVILLAGEGGEASVVRRLRAICASRDLKLEELPIIVCTRAPDLSDSVQLGVLAAKLAAVAPVLLIVDPLYLSAGSAAKGDNLYAMGQMLGRIQALCEDAGCALFVVTHFNRRAGNGHLRITGAGPAEWGRVLISADVVSRHTDPGTGETSVLTRLAVIGSEVPGDAFCVLRVIRAGDPGDLDSPLHYTVTVTRDDDSAGTGKKMPPAKKKLLEALRAIGDPAAPVSGMALVDWIKEKYSHGLTRQTCSKYLNELAGDGLADSLDPGSGRDKLWFLPRRHDDGDGANRANPTRRHGDGDAVDLGELDFDDPRDDS